MRDHKHDQQYVDSSGKTVTVYNHLTEQEASTIRRHKKGAEVRVTRTRSGSYSVTVRE